MGEVRWAIIGPGLIANNFAGGLEGAGSARLVAVASRDRQRAVDFGGRWGVEEKNCHGDYAAVFGSDEVDAVYISTIHTKHAQLAIEALAAGKHVVCEKPAGINAAEVSVMIDCARRHGLFFLEAYMYRFHPQIARLRELISQGVVGEVRHINAVFGFAAPHDPTSRLYSPELAGGGILDVGGYPVSLARLAAGAAQGKQHAEPQRVRGTGRMSVDSSGGVGGDAEAHLLLEFEGGITASCSCSVDRDLGEEATVYGSKGKIILADPWVPGRDAPPADSAISVVTSEDTTIEEFKVPALLYELEVEAASKAILAGKQEVEQMNWDDSIGNNRVLDAWRDEIGYVLPDEDLEKSQPLIGAAVAADIPRIEVAGVPVAMSQLVMGCDNQVRGSDGAAIWDAWLEAGGNAFDTAHLYCDGVTERLLGAWIKSRGVRDEVAVIVKGAHTPWCDPINLRLQFEESLERLGIERADVYMMHRDNEDYPVGEFVDAMDELASKGLIGAYGGSNWGLPRLREANEWARTNGKKPLTVLSNNLSLAVMVNVWPGCKTGHDDELLAYLRDEGMAHFSWSSQARGYFIPESERGPLMPGTEAEVCFGSEENAARRKRAEELSRKKGVSANHIALAWTLSQPIKSFALVGPRSVIEIDRSMPALDVELSAEEIAWLDKGS